MKGNITRRGKNSFRLKFDAGIDANGKRKIQYHTFRGSKREAQDKLTELMASFGRVLTSRQARPWSAILSAAVSTNGKHPAKSQRSRQLGIVNSMKNIAPFIGGKVLQKLRRTDIESWHTTLRNSGHEKGKGGIGPRTIGHAHRVLSKALTMPPRITSSSASSPSWRPLLRPPTTKW